MKRWLLIATFVWLVSCATQPTPTLPPTVPTLGVATVVPIPTLLPTVTIPAPTNVPLTVTPEPSPTRRTTTSTTATNKFPAPQAIGPQSPTLFKDGNDIKFVYGAVGKLQTNQCYLFHVEMVNPAVNPGNRGDDFLDTANCGDAGPVGKQLNFVLYRGKFTASPNYGTILAEALALSPNVPVMKMTWLLRVVQNNGRAADGVHYNTVALSPNSPRVELDFEP